MPSGLAKVLLFVKAAPILAKRSLQNLIFGAVKQKPWTPPSQTSRKHQVLTIIKQI